MFAGAEYACLSAMGTHGWQQLIQHHAGAHATIGWLVSPQVSRFPSRATRRPPPLWGPTLGDAPLSPPSHELIMEKQLVHG